MVASDVLVSVTCTKFCQNLPSHKQIAVWVQTDVSEVILRNERFCEEIANSINSYRMRVEVLAWICLFLGLFIDSVSAAEYGMGNCKIEIM
jgi:hypothetical protein